MTEQEIIVGLLGAKFADESSSSIMREIENVRLEDKNGTRYRGR